MYFNHNFFEKLITLCILIPFGVFAFVFLVNNTVQNNGLADKNNFVTVFDTSSSSIQSDNNPYKIEKKINLPILMYHRIDTLEKIQKSDKIGVGLRVSPEILEKQLQYLVAKKYNTINSFQIQDYLEGKAILPENPILLTFDDGFQDSYDNAFPLLKKYNMTADFGIITSVIGTGEYMSLDNLKEMKNAGMGFASHTHNHCTIAVKDNLGKFVVSPVNETEQPCSKFAAQEKLNTGQIKFEFAQSKKSLETNLGIKVSHLIYPFGFHNTQAHEIAKDTGYTFATTVAVQKRNIADFNNPFEVSRTRVEGQQNGELSGFFVNT
jgi:Polysaccharide deacetylase